MPCYGGPECAMKFVVRANHMAPRRIEQVLHVGHVMLTGPYQFFGHAADIHQGQSRDECCIRSIVLRARNQTSIKQAKSKTRNMIRGQEHAERDAKQHALGRFTKRRHQFINSWYQLCKGSAAAKCLSV